MLLNTTVGVFRISYIGVINEASASTLPLEVVSTSRYHSLDWVRSYA
jgi:hypothetical protein